MKKFLAIILGTLFVLSFAASAFAIHAEIPEGTQSVVAKGDTQFTLGGLLRTRGWYFKNNEDNAFSGQNANAQPFKTKSKAFYDQRARFSFDAKVTPNVQGYVLLQGDWKWGAINAKGDHLDVIESWITYKGSDLFGFNAGLKVGHMPLALGEQQFFQHTTNGDDAIVFFMDPTKELHVGLLTIKLGGDGKAAAFSTNSAGNNHDDLDAYVGLMTYKLDDKNVIGLNYTYLNESDVNLSLQNLGFHAKGDMSGLGYKAEVDFQFGENGDSDYKGYAVMAGLNYKVDPVNVRAGFAMGSGDNDSTDGEIKDFQTFLSDDVHYALAYDYRVATTAGKTLTGLSNTTYFNLGVDFSPTKDLKAKLDGYVLRATKAPGGVSKSAGWEVDAGISYNVAKNLLYTLDLGYFKAGDWYEDMYPTKGSAKGSTAVRQQLILSF